MKNRVRSTVVGVCLAASSAILGGACTGGAPQTKLGDVAYADGHFRRALEHYLAARKSGASGPEFEIRLQNARLAVAMNQAQERYFAGHLEEALRDLHRILAVRPGDEKVDQWISKVRYSLCEKHMLAGRQKAVMQDFQGAQEELAIAKKYWPAHPEVAALDAQVQEWRRRQLAKAERYYDQGNRSESENQLLRAWKEFVQALFFDPEHPVAAKRMVRDREQVLKNWMKKIDLMMSKGNWYACESMLKKEILSQDPDFAPALKILPEIEHEREAHDLLAQARLYLSRGEFDEARRALERGRLLTTRQEKDFAREKIALRAAEFVAAYLQGRKFEHEGRYEHALAQYQGVANAINSDPQLYELTLPVHIPLEDKEVLDLSYDPQEFLVHPKIWFIFARARDAASDLQQKLTFAARYYKEALALEEHGKRREALQLYRDLLLDLPHYLDVEDRCRKLQERSGAGAPKGGANSSAGEQPTSKGGVF